MSRLMVSLLLAAALSGCRSAPRSPREALPASVDGAALREPARDVSIGGAPEDIRKAGLRGAASAVYEGQNRFEVTLYELGAPASAFELMQKWRPAEGRMAFYRERYFGVVQSAGADRASLAAFALSLDRRLKVN